MLLPFNWSEVTVLLSPEVMVKGGAEELTVKGAATAKEATKLVAMVSKLAILIGLI
jgi:hypothetical protein